MAGVSTKSLDTPDEIRTPDKTKVDVLRLGGETVARFTFQPGCRWSECVKPVAGTDSCQVRHVGAIVAGRLRVVHNDGREGEVAPGDAYVIEPGHDAWVVGDDPVVAFEFESAEPTLEANGGMERGPVRSPAANGIPSPTSPKITPRLSQT
jgi:quercetin dioxygenase-like cupin family protein